MGGDLHDEYRDSRVNYAWIMWQAARAGQAASVPGRNDLVDTVYLELGKRFNFNVDSPLDMVAYLVDAGFIAEPTKAGARP
jgi:hypothetical protein